MREEHLHKLKEHQRAFGLRHLHDLIKDPSRIQKHTHSTKDLTFCFANHWLTPAIEQTFDNIASECRLQDSIHDLFNGEPVNFTTNDPALHCLARTPESALTHSRLLKPWQAMQSTLARMTELHDRIASSDLPIRHIVHIGTGGSLHAVRTAYTALRQYRHPELQCHFISQMDLKPLAELLDGLDAEQTLVVAVSKSFSTTEVMTAADYAGRWLVDRLGSGKTSEHFLAVTAFPEKAYAAGYDKSQVFAMDPHIGGRYSLWSPVSLSLFLCIGAENFAALLEGAHQMDQHFRYTPFASNTPVIAAMLDVWHVCAWNVSHQAIISYAPELETLSDTVQQLWMESLGKCADKYGNKCRYSGSVLFGGPATESQHTFHQHLHQGQHMIPVDIILPIQRNHPQMDSHLRMIANALGQSECLAHGSAVLEAPSGSTINAYRYVHGDQPNTLVLMHDLTPQSLGTLLAFYEHRVYVQSALLGLNAFDQYGVELGKTLATDYYRRLTGEDSSQDLGVSTGLLPTIKSLLSDE